MPSNKYAAVRYGIIKSLLISKSSVTKEEMREACEEALYGQNGGRICSSTIEKDIWALRNENHLGQLNITYDRDLKGYRLILDTKLLKRDWVDSFSMLCSVVDEISNKKGWDFNPDNVETVSSKIALMHSELSEALEALRTGNGPDNHIPKFSGMEAEFADVIIRIMHVAHKMNLRVAEAILEKLEYNTSRPYKHGGKKL